MMNVSTARQLQRLSATRQLPTLSQRLRNDRAVLSASHIHTFALSRDEERRQEKQAAAEQRRQSALPLIQTSAFHTSAAAERGAVAIIMGLGALSAASYAASSAVKAYKEYQASLPEVPPEEETTANAEEPKAGEAKKNEEEEGPRENIFMKFFGGSAGSSYYQGGFEDQMTRQEAALILGVRQSSSASRIKAAHRKLLVLNHPDTGGSTYLAGKINEAKELLLKGKRGA